ncbi:hypothetical protein ACFVZP_39465, partial [Streptomyces bottropensis]
RERGGGGPVGWGVEYPNAHLPLKPVPVIAPALDRAPVASIEKRTVAAESTPTRRATGRVPEAARSARPRRSAAQLLDEARTATADWPAAKVTAEGIRRALRTSPANARTLRDTLLAERARTAAVTPVGA